MKKNRYLIIILILALTTPIMYEMNQYDQNNQNTSEIFVETPKASDPYKVLYFGTTEGPFTIDPIDSWDSASNDVIRQVAETLFQHDLNNSDLPLEPLLVDYYELKSTTDLYIELREDVWFHNYDKMDADAVIWNINRWIYLTNSTGTLPPSTAPAFPSSLYFLPNGTAMLAGATKEGDYNLTIHLNGAFIPFTYFLSCTSNSIIAPDPSYETEYIDVNTGDLIGTGPFMYDGYEPDVEVRFSRWDGYWREPSAINNLIFKLFEDRVISNNALLAGDIDILKDPLPDLMEIFQADPDIHVEDIGMDLIYWYMAFNNRDVNVTWRKALAYAYNYSYVIDVIRSGNAVRGCPAVPVGMPGHNASVQANLPGEIGTFADNIKIARQYMQSMGFGTTWDANYPGTNETLWTSANFRTFEVNTHEGNPTSIKLNQLAADNWDLIGVDINETSRVWAEFLETAENNPEDMEIWYRGRGPDYVDTFNMLDPLFNNASPYNFIQLNDPLVQDLLKQAAEETDAGTRVNIYMRLQYILFIKEVVHMPLWTSLQQVVHQESLTDFPYNVLNYFYFYPCNTTVSPSGPFDLSSDADYPDLDGTFTLNWTDSLGADNYSVYYDTSYFYEINGSVIQLADMITETELLITDFPPGIYYFLVEAINQHGSTLSGPIPVVVYDFDPNKRSAIFEGLYLNYSINVRGQGGWEFGLNYTYLGSNTFQVNYTVGSTTGSYLVNNFTRTKEQSTSWFIWMYGHFTPFWIFQNQEMGDLIYIDTPTERDRLFNVTGETVCAIPDFLPFNCWVLNSTEDPYSHAYYDKYTGILLDGYFTDLSGTSNYTLTLVSTNMEFFHEFPPLNFTLSTDAEDPDTDGIFNLMWTESQKANNYTIYQQELGGSLIILAEEITDLTYLVENFYNGTFIYFIKAHNNYGDTISNSIMVNINVEGNRPGEFLLASTAESPELDGNFTLVWSSSEGAISYTVYQHSSYITVINGSLTLLSADLEETSFSITNCSDGVYYFIVVAHNSFGDINSNCISVVVLSSTEKPPFNPVIITFFIIGIISIISISIWILLKKFKKN